jgi:hypothetical protein
MGCDRGALFKMNAMARFQNWQKFAAGVRPSPGAATSVGPERRELRKTFRWRTWLWPGTATLRILKTHARTNTAPITLIAGVALLFAAVPSGRAQQNGPQHATDFTSTEYYEPPHQRQIKSILSGAEASPQPGGRLIVKQLKLEIFNLDGKLEIIILAPECIYDTLKGVANSPGHLQLRTGDGKILTEGDGFLWRQSEQLLTISNHVSTVIESGATMNIKP